MNILPILVNSTSIFCMLLFIHVLYVLYQIILWSMHFTAEIIKSYLKHKALHLHLHLHTSVSYVNKALDMC